MIHPTQILPGQRSDFPATAFAALMSFIGLAVLVSRFSPETLLLVTAGGAFLLLLAAWPERRRLLTALMLIAAPLNIDYTFLRQPSPGGADGLILSATDILMLLLMGLTLMRALQHRCIDELFSFPAILVPSLVLAATYLLSMLHAEDLLWSSFDLLSLGKTILFFWLLANNIRNRRDLQFVLVALFVALIIETLLAVLMTFFPASVEWMAAIKLGVSKELIESKEYLEEYYRSGGTIGNTNHLARYQGLILPLALINALTERRFGMWLLSVLASVVGVLGILATMTRSAWVGLAVSIAVISCLIVSRRLLTMRIVGRFGLFLLFGILLLVIFHRPITDRLFGDDKGSAYTRVTTTKVALAIIRDHPFFGCGINNYGNLLDDYWLAEDVFTRKAPVHNNYLIYAAEIGLVGLTAYIWLLVTAGLRMRRAVRLRDPLFAATAIGISAAFIGYLMGAITDKSYKECYTLLLTFWGLLAMVEAILRMDKKSTEGMEYEHRAKIGF